jgi:hypothetical protein
MFCGPPKTMTGQKFKKGEHCESTPVLTEPSKDSIPDVLKEHFFDSSCPSLMTDYDVVGFDVDNTLVKYKIKAVTKLAVSAYLADLAANGYPADLVDFDYEKNLNVCLNNAVWDIEKGVIIRLGEDKLVTHAIRGFKGLSRGEI